MRNLSKKLGDMTHDGLITDLTPAVVVRGGTIAALEAETTLARGTILAKSTSTGKLVVLGNEAGEGDTLTPDCVLCDDTTVGTEDAVANVYYAGCFDPNKCAVKSGYTITEADKDKLRERGILFKAASDAD